MRGYEAAQILKEKGITVEDVAEEITYRKETNAFSLCFFLTVCYPLSKGQRGRK